MTCPIVDGVRVWLIHSGRAAAFVSKMRHIFWLLQGWYAGVKCITDNGSRLALAAMSEERARVAVRTRALVFSRFWRGVGWAVFFIYLLLI